jgi:hypothetical protein
MSAHKVDPIPFIHGLSKLVSDYNEKLDEAKKIQDEESVTEYAWKVLAIEDVGKLLQVWLYNDKGGAS